MLTSLKLETLKKWHCHEKPFLWYSILVLIVAGTSALVFGKVFQQPFVQDDWGVLYYVKTTPVSNIIAQAFFPRGGIFYRPLGMLYFLFMVKVFGVAPFPYHCFAFLLHLCNSLLVALVIREITGRRVLSAAVALLYALATTIHGDLLLWMVGFYDLAAGAFFLSAIFLYLRRRPILSGAAFLLGLLTKEACAPLLVILVIHALVMDRARLRLLWLHTLVFTIYVSSRFLNVDFVGLGASNPYQLSFQGTVIINNIIQFLEWAFQVIFPYRSIAYSFLEIQLVVGLTVLALTLLAFVIVRRNGVVEKLKVRQCIFLVSWVALGVSPVLPLMHHLARYYALYSLAPLITLFLFYAETILPHQVGRYVGIPLMIFIIANAAGNWSSFNYEFDHASVNYVYGTNNLIRKTHTVHIAQSQMLLHYPSLPRGSRIVLSGISTAPFRKSIGPRLWYDDTTMEVYSQGEYDSLCIQGRIDRGHTYFMTFVDDTLMH